MSSKFCLVVVFIAGACGGGEWVYKKCEPKQIVGVWENVGELRDKLESRWQDNLGGDLRFFVCQDDFEFQGLFLGCGEMYVLERVALRAARHEAAHCYRERLFGDSDGAHADADYWRFVE